MCCLHDKLYKQIKSRYARITEKLYKWYKWIVFMLYLLKIWAFRQCVFEFNWNISTRSCLHYFVNESFKKHVSTNSFPLIERVRILKSKAALRKLPSHSEDVFVKSVLTLWWEAWFLRKHSSGRHYGWF